MLGNAPIVDADLIECWLAVFQDEKFTTAQITEAFRLYTKSNEFFPKPRNIIEIAKRLRYEEYLVGLSPDERKELGMSIETQERLEREQAQVRHANWKSLRAFLKESHPRLYADVQMRKTQPAGIERTFDREPE